MKYSALSFLACVRCGHGLRASASQEMSGEIVEGQLACECGAVYPVRQGIPEFLPETYVKSFSYQWQFRENSPLDNRLAREVNSSFLATIGVAPDRLAGKRVLDAGCGSGAFSLLMAEHGAEAVGLDMSEGVWVAAKRSPELPRPHFVRGNILVPPLADASFDAVFSMGVLHHTSNTREAFLRLTRLVRPGGLIAIWVYSAYGRYGYAASDLLRKITVHLPPHLLYALCHLAVPLDALQSIPVLGIPFRVVRVAGGGPWQSVVLGTYDWYSPRFQFKHTFPEVFGWFEEAGLVEIRVHDWAIAVSGRRPR
ncbi:MAG TPA: methyltransferase domain-containing protein [Candidatus Polarisedimenticolia bacterium]|nr:methyltransferase domain-containing protein [Candidatus Polarisedimenticolia bacterium]